ncbi:hypothetical protein FRIGORI9N_80119 [Frigoribacterium sp. 9N]|nr:hypothetical protein FRIGORI9N_80119 [Frigoribacterium sp. 9N]
MLTAGSGLWWCADLTAHCAGRLRDATRGDETTSVMRPLGSPRDLTLDRRRGKATGSRPERDPVAGSSHRTRPVPAHALRT